MTRTAFVTVVVLLFTGCTLGPDYLRPKVLVPDNYRGVAGAPAAEDDRFRVPRILEES